MKIEPPISESMVDRAAGCVVGALIGDALGVGPHWYYDIAELRKDYGPWINDYMAPKPGRYHSGVKPGELSQTGIIMKLLLESMAKCGKYSEADFCHRLDEELLPHLDGTPRHGPGGYTNHSFRHVWHARVREKKPWGQVAGNADTSEAAERLTLIAARYAADSGALAKYAASCCVLTQNDLLVVQQSVAFALVLGALIRGEALDEQLSEKLMALVKEGEVPFAAMEGAAQSSLRGRKTKNLCFPSPDALLLPSWIAEIAHDPAIRIEPAWKVSLIYGMSCAINFVLPASYYLAARFHGDFESAVLHALNGGGQNMSRACLTGALVGAQAGLKGIPRRYIDGLHNGKEIVSLAVRVAEKASEVKESHELLAGSAK